MCVRKITTALSTQLNMLGPRTSSQFEELFTRVTESVKWASSYKLTEFSKCYVIRDNMFMHPIHAEASDLASQVDFVPLPVQFSQSKASVSTYVRSLIDVKKINGRWCARAKTKYQMYDIGSIRAGIDAAGTNGILRSDIAGEYKNAYTDLQTLVSSKDVFATPTRVWSRQVAPEIPAAKGAAFRKKFNTLLCGI